MENTSVEVNSTNALFSFPTPTTEGRPGSKHHRMPDISGAPGLCLAKPKAARTFKMQSKKRTSGYHFSKPAGSCTNIVPQGSRAGQATDRVLTLTSSKTKPASFKDVQIGLQVPLLHHFCPSHQSGCPSPPQGPFVTSSVPILKYDEMWGI